MNRYLRREGGCDTHGIDFFDILPRRAFGVTVVARVFLASFMVGTSSDALRQAAQERQAPRQNRPIKAQMEFSSGGRTLLFS